MQPELFPIFVEIAQTNKMEYKVACNDFQSWIDAEKPLRNQKEGFAFDKYNRLEDIHQFLEDTENIYPETVSVFTVGESYEGRLIKGMKIESNVNNPGIFIEANIHAREWISSATAIWIINEILTTTDPAIKEIIESVTWYITPVTNPDGKIN